MDNIEFIQSADGSKTLFNHEYKEHYSSLSDGAKSEKLGKHIFPVAEFIQKQDSIWILDICFGLGYTAFLSAKVLRHQAKNIHIISLEKDKKTLEFATQIHNLSPKIIDNLKNGTQTHIAPNVSLQILWGDAKESLYTFLPHTFDIVYQDPFSYEKNQSLWDSSHFSLLFSLTKDSCLISTYATKSVIRHNARNAGFKVYRFQAPNLRASSLFAKQHLHLTNATLWLDSAS